MRSDRRSAKEQRKKLLVCALAAAIMLLLSLPAFALSGSSAEEAAGTEPAEQTEQTQQAGTDGQTEAEKTEEPADLTEEAAGGESAPSGKEKTESENEETAGAAPEKDAGAPETPAAKAPMLKALPANNTKVSYTSAGSHPVKFTVKSGGYTFKGTCATLGVDNASSGKATVKRISNTSKIAKLVYYYGYRKGWWTGSNSTKKATTVLGFTDKNCTENAKQCIEALIQRDNMGWTAFWNARKVGKYRMYSTDSFMREINELYKKDVSKITIPDDVVFEMFHGVTSSSKQQDFYVWRYKEIPTTPNGFCAVEKVSADVSITN